MKKNKKQLNNPTKTSVTKTTETFTRETTTNLDHFFNMWTNILNSWSNLFTQTSKMWQEMAQMKIPGAETWLKISEDAFSQFVSISSTFFRKDIVDRFLDGVRVYVRLTKFWMDAIEVLRSKPVEKAFDEFLQLWRTTYRGLFKEALAIPIMRPFMEFFRKMLQISDASKDITPISKTGIDAYLRTIGAWLESFEQVSEKIIAAFEGDKGVDTWKEIYNSWVKAYEETLGKFIKVPPVGPARAPMEKFLRTIDAAIRLCGASIDFILQLETAWVESMEEISEKVAQIIGQKEGLDAYREFYNLLIKTCEERYAQLFRSPSFTFALEILLKNFLDFYKNYQEVMEILWKGGPFPTRGEIDEIYKELYLLKKKV